MKLRIFLFTLALFLLLPFSASAEPLPQLEQAIRDGCEFEQTRDLSGYSITAEDFNRLFTQMHQSGQLPWYTQEGYTYHYDESTGYLLDFTPESLDPQVYRRDLYEQRLAEVMDACILEGMTPEQIALSVHDYLILNCVYDETLEKNTGYDLLVHGSTVCAGYTALYMDILNRAGIPCVSVSSEAMEHTWNLVQLNGQWYHADLTWDDPSPNRYGYVSHEFFLVSDDRIREGQEPHTDWDTWLTCTDTGYADAWWRSLETGVIYETSDRCYYQRTEDFVNYICRREADRESLLYTEPEGAIDIGYGAYTYEHRGLSLRDGRLLFNTLDSLCSVDTEGGDLRVLYRHTDPDTYLYSFSVSGDTAWITTAGHDNISGVYSTQLPPVEQHIHSYDLTETPGTCLLGGYTTGQCQCGVRWQSPPTTGPGHDFRETDKKRPNLFSDGYIHWTCSVCDETKTETLPRTQLSDLLYWILDIFGIL